MPFKMYANFKISPLVNFKWDGIVWYSPSIFFGPLVKKIKKKSTCRAYLIVRDIFPQWLVDLGLINRFGLPYLIFNRVAEFQYSIADIIGVQTEGNLKYFDKWIKKYNRNVNVLQNWLDKSSKKKCQIKLDKTILSGRKIFIYAGNMGVAQDAGIILKVAKSLSFRKDIGFLLVGRGSEVLKLKQLAKNLKLKNLIFFNEIDPDEIPDLYSKCHVGLVILNSKHKSHNIPGKFLTYIRSGLPVLAVINQKNDLAEIIRKEKVGLVCESNNVDIVSNLAVNLIEDIDKDSNYFQRCKKLFENKFSVNSAVNQIVKSLTD
jgi:glycosyltransferase involved in cell wall biosynthesis